MKLAQPDAIVMHPGPIVRGLELANEVADGPQSCVHEQVANGVKTRMAILATVLEGGPMKPKTEHETRCSSPEDGSSIPPVASTAKWMSCCATAAWPSSPRPAC